MIAILLRMGMGRSLVTLGLGIWLGACSVEEGGSGADCVRSTECEMGLVCIEGACSDDLSLIGDPGEVPMLMPEAGVDVVTPDASEQVAPDASDMMGMATDAAVTPADGG